MQVFIDSVNRYFNEVHQLGVEIGTPYLVENKQLRPEDYTGIIGISGPMKGCVYFTAPQVLLRNVLISYGMSGTEDRLLDLAGEVANTISGNARSVYGKDFMISVPIVVKGKLENMRLPTDSRSYVIPVEWKQYKASIVVCLKEKQNSNH
ncbi:MAG: chemotaxis protein CheX [Cardiobacteriales bacterium]|nr:MAG: chemotaxis protein CheX [Cardiobacteriales bacterium]